MIWGISGILPESEKLLPLIKSGGFDYIEVPLAPMLETCNDAQIEAFAAQTKATGISVYAYTHLFPNGMPLFGKSADKKQTESYLRDALTRIMPLGGDILVLESNRVLPADTDENGYRDFLSFLVDTLLPLVREFHKVVAVLPQNGSCEFLRTYLDSRRTVCAVADSSLSSMISRYDAVKNAENFDLYCSLQSRPLYAQIASDTKSFPQRNDGSDYRPFFRFLESQFYTAGVTLCGEISENGVREAAKSLVYLKKISRI